MVTTVHAKQAGVGTAGQGVPRAAPQDGGQPTAARLTAEQVWHQVAKASFAVLGYVTPSGEPRSSGVVYKSVGRRLYVAVAPDSWKARHIAASRRASACLIEVVPEGAFVTYGIGVPLAKLRSPAATRARVPVTPEGRTR